jgi:Protein of unknown function (DUF1552)
VALPWMESLVCHPLWGQNTNAMGNATGQPIRPLRTAFLYVPNGMHMENWRPDSPGPLTELPVTLEPLAPFRDDLLVLSGLAQRNAAALGDGAGDHARGAAVFLTGVHPRKTDGRDIQGGVSVDQVLAAHHQRDTRFPSLEIGCEAGELAGNCDSGYSCAYSHTISWRAPDSPNPKEVHPRQLFDRLFGDPAANAMDMSQARYLRQKKSILDLVRDDAARMHTRMGKGDRRKLDEYLDGIRALERRLEFDEEDPDIRLPGSIVKRPTKVPKDFAAHVRIMGDLMVLAFQADMTRVATFMFADEGSNRTYPSLGIDEGHHAISHHDSRPEQLEKIARINRYHVEQLAYILRRMKETPDGEGNLLDNTLLAYGGGISDGNRHNHNDLPVLVAGHARGRVLTGRHVEFEQDTPLMNLFIAMLQSAGIQQESLGDSTGPLSDIFMS